MGPAILVGDPAEWYARLRGRGDQLLAGLVANGVEVLAAGWVRTDTDPQQYLYIVSPWVDLGRAREGYAVLQAIDRAAHPAWRPLEVKLISATAPLADGLTYLTNQYADPAGEPVTYTGDQIGWVSIVGPALIYPTPKPAPAAGG